MAQAITEKKAIDTAVEFESAIAEAQLEDLGSVEVTQKFMEKFLKKKGIDSFTYGHPGVRVFVEGKADQVMRDEELDVYTAYENEIKAKKKAK